MRLEPREGGAPAWTVAAPLLACLAALALGAVPLALSGADVPTAYARMAQGALGSRFALAETLARATPLILTGLAAAIAFRARFWNIGGEGQLYMGALAAVALGAGPIDLPPLLLIPLVLIGSGLAGAGLVLVPLFLRLKLAADEVVTTLLLNFVVLLFVGMMLEGPMKDPLSMGWPQSAPVLPNVELPKLLDRTRLHAGLILAVAAAFVLAFIDGRTVPGLMLRAAGANPRAAAYLGVPVGGVLIGVGLASGALAGLAGAVEVVGLKGYVTRDLSPGYGYAGIVVATLAGLRPISVVPAAIFIAGLFVGADSMSRAMAISSTIANLIVATSLLTMLVAGLLARYRLRW